MYLSTQCYMVAEFGFSNPFVCGENLNNIASGMHAQATVNADNAIEVGSRILN